MKKVLVLLMPLFLLLAACSSTNVTNSWKERDADYTSLKKLMVLALLPEKERMLRQEMEDEMVQRLSERGFNAVSSLSEYGPKSFTGLTEQQVMEQLDDRRVDGIITISLQDTEKTEDYVPGSVRYEPYAVRYNRFYRTYQTFYQRYYTPGYTREQTNFFFETNLYGLKGNKLLYSAQSKSFDPSSAGQIARELAKAVVKDMEKNNIQGQAVATK